MVRQIHLEQLYDAPKEKLGEYPTEADFDEIIDEDCDVYVEGQLSLTFRKKALKSLVDITPDSDTYKYWRWASRALVSDQRGNAAGKEISTNVEIRLTFGQKKFFSQAIKKELTLDEALELVESDTRPSRDTYYVGKTESDNLVDLDEIEKWDQLVRKKATSDDLRKEATQKRNAAKLAWFDNWLRNVWAVADDKVAAAKAGKKRYCTTQPRGNKAYSNVLGTIDRSGRTPFGRLTKSTTDKYEDFCAQSELFREVDNKLKETMPETWAVLSKRFKQVKDEAYNLFGTVFTSITMNWNFQVAYHYDGNNAQNAAAALTVLEKGTYEGSEFVFPQLRLAFNIRQGDFLGGDNQGLMHAMMPFKNTSPDFESVWFVFYQRDSIIQLDSLKCEVCRRQFMDHITQNHPELGTGEKKWNGSFIGMWGSTYWEDYKRLRTEEEGYDYTGCSNTNIKGKPDNMPVEIRHPELAK